MAIWTFIIWSFCRWLSRGKNCWIRGLKTYMTRKSWVKIELWPKWLGRIIVTGIKSMMCILAVLWSRMSRVRQVRALHTKPLWKKTWKKYLKNWTTLLKPRLRGSISGSIISIRSQTLKSIPKGRESLLRPMGKSE